MPTVEVGCESLSSVLTPALVNVGVKAEAVAQSSCGQLNVVCQRKLALSNPVATKAVLACSLTMMLRRPLWVAHGANFGLSRLV